MFLTEKVWSAKQTDPYQTAREHGVSGKLVGLVVVFFVSWLVTYNKAYIAGADVNTFQASGYGTSTFFPKPEPGWIPNRVADMYGRNLVLHVFDLVYFPAKSLFGADFFFVFKIFNATIFAIFLCFVYRYMFDQIVVQERLLREDRGEREGNVLAGLFLAFVILSILPWVTEIGMVCYQLPAFLCFVVFAELLKLMPRFSVPGQAGIPVPWLMTIAFVAAFSLEAYSAVLLVAIICAWALNFPWRSREVWRSQAFIVSCFLAAYCVAALIITVLFSQRPDSTAKLSATKQIREFFFANKLLSHDAKIYCLILFVGVLAPLLIAASVPFYRRLMRRNSAIAGLTSFLVQRLSVTRWMLFLLLVLFPTMIITSLISLETGYDYFSLYIYPWGGLLLVAVLFAVPAIVMPIVWFWEGRFLADMARIFVMMLLISGAVTRSIGDSARYYDNSVKVLNGYRAAQANSTGVFDTGLSLDAMSIKLRPLPTAHSPSDWIQSFPQFFKKYYGTNTTILFR